MLMIFQALLVLLISQNPLLTVAAGSASPSPLVVDQKAVAAQVGTRLQLDPFAYEQLRDQSEVLIRKFPLSDTQDADLILTSIDPLSASTQIVSTRQDENGQWYDELIPRPDCLAFGGTVLGKPESSVFLGLSPYGCHGWITLDDEIYVISSGPFRENTNDCLIFNLTAIDPELINMPEFVCNALEVPGAPLASVKRKLTRPKNRSLGTTCRRIDLAIETDAEFTNSFSNNQTAAASYAVILTAAKNRIYRRDVNVTFEIEFLRLWPNDDIWDQGDAGGQLTQFQAYWSTEMTHVHRHLAHFLSTRPLGGGVAWLGVACNSTYGFALSGNLDGYFPQPLEDNNSDNWDIVVYAHETGHNLGTGHTHDYDPQIDNCAGGECDDAAVGTLMSYCHLCDGGISNMQLRLHPTVQDAIVSYLDSIDTSSCFIGGGPTTAHDDYVTVTPPDAITIDVLANDEAVACEYVILVSFDDTSLQGGSIESEQATGEAHLLYTPPTDDSVANDQFQYTMRSPDGETDSATVFIDILIPRPPENPVYVAPGVLAQYYDVGPLEVLPDFETLDSFDQEVVTTIDFPSTSDAFGGSGMADEVGAVYSGYIEIPVADTYTFTTNSDDGSALYIGDTLVVNNDGLHGMQSVSGQIALEAGRHAVRVEFFERYGGAGLIVSFSGGGLSSEVVGAEYWFHPVPPEPGDANHDGNVDVSDFSLLLIHWGTCTSTVECIADFDLNGTVDIEDFSIMLTNFGS